MKVLDPITGKTVVIPSSPSTVELLRKQIIAAFGDRLQGIQIADAIDRLIDAKMARPVKDD